MIRGIAEGLDPVLLSELLSDLGREARRFHDVVQADDVVRQNLRHEVGVVRRGCKVDDGGRAFGGATDGLSVGEIANV